MLSKEDIKKYNIINIEDGSEPPDSQFDTTSYNLRLGKQFLLIDPQGNTSNYTIGDCSKGVGIINLPPFSCALVSSEEWISLPDNVFGRWGLKIRPAMSGLVFQAGPQIEPGSQGRLFGLLFNLSSNERQLHYLTSMWSIDFQRIAGSKRKIVAVASSAPPILDMTRYTQMGIPTGSLGEIYSEFKRLQRQVVGRRDIFTTILVTLVVLVSSTLLPVVVTKLTYDKDDTREIWERQIELLKSIDEKEARLSDIEERLDLELSGLDLMNAIELKKTELDSLEVEIRARLLELQQFNTDSTNNN